MTFASPSGLQSSLLAATGFTSSWWVEQLSALNQPLTTLLTLSVLILTILKIYQLITKGGNKE